MRDGWLGDRDVQDLARQAVDLLFPAAQVSVDALNGLARAGGTTWGGLSMGRHRPRRVTVRIGPGDQCVIGVNSDWTPVQTLAHLIGELGGACGHQFRGNWFPPCPGHDHASEVGQTDTAVVLTCPDTGQPALSLSPELEP